MSRGRIVRWMLEELGLPYETSIMSYAEGSGSDHLLADGVRPDGSIKSEAYLRINPMGKVPAIRHGDIVVTEVAAICAYLADAFPDAGLGPSGSERGTYYRWLFFAAGPLEAASANKMFGFEITKEQQAMAGYGSLPRVVNALESALGNGPYITGDRFSAADVYVGSHIDWGVNMMKTIPDKPVFTEYLSRLKDRGAYIRANELDDSLLKSRR